MARSCMASQVHINSLNLSLNFKPRFDINYLFDINHLVVLYQMIICSNSGSRKKMAPLHGSQVLY